MDIVEKLRDGGETCGVDRCEFRDKRSGCVCAIAADEIERLREALFAIVCNTEPSAVKHRDYDHLANAIYVWASAALGEDKK